MIKKILLLAIFLFLPLSALAAAEAAPAADRDLALLIAKSRLNWRGWELEALGAPDSVNYLWDFGDGQLGAGQKIKHDFPGAGTYKITLSGSDGAGAVGQIEETISVGFWHLDNPYLQILLGVLGLGIIALTVVISFNLFPKYGISKV